jgi:hypothetical protein
MAVELLGPTSHSELSTLLCPKKYEFRYVRGLVPKTMGTALATGIFWHKCAAAGYEVLRKDVHSSGWLEAAMRASYEENPVDRDGIPLGLTPEQTEAMRHMLIYFWENQGRFDEFKEIHIIDEVRYFDFAGWRIRFTIDLAATMHDNRFVLTDHKTSSDITADLGFLSLDLQTHLYYLGAYRTLERRPDEFVHNYVRRFDFTSDQMTGPPAWKNVFDGEMPYLKTKSGRTATRSSEVEDYLQRSRTPLTLTQLAAFALELTAQLAAARYHHVSGTYPRHAQKGNMGCSNCAYFSPCTTEMDGHELNPSAMAQIYTVMP